MWKTSSKQLLLLLWALSAHSGMHGEWWTTQVGKLPENFAQQYAKSLRENTDLFEDGTPLFPDVPKKGVIRWYHVLGVSRDAERKIIIQKWKRLVLATHTDTGMENGELIKAVNVAKEEAFPSLEDSHFFWDGEYKSRYNKRFQFKGPGIIPHLDSLEDLFARGGDSKDGKKVQTTIESGDIEKWITDWKRFYLTKFGFLAGITLGYAYLKKLHTSDKDSWIKNKTIQKSIAWWLRVKKNHPNKATTFKVSRRAVFIAIAGIYPVYRFSKIFDFSSLNNLYRSETTPEDTISDDDLKLFYKRVHTATRERHTSNGTEYEPIYESTPPIGYMTDEENRTMFMPLRKTKVMTALSLGASFALTWLGCVP